MRLYYRSFLPLVLFVFSLSASAATRYPVKTLVEGDSVLQAGDGVVNFDFQKQVQRWHSVSRIHTHEIVSDDTRLYTAGSSGAYGLDKGSGALLWHFSAGEELFAPVLSNEVLYLSGKNGFMAAVESARGTLIWKARLGDGWIYPPAVAGELLVTGGQERVIRALDRCTGAVIWIRNWSTGRFLPFLYCAGQ